MVRLPAYAAVALVLLRLLCGWHFYNEGVKKLDPSFSSAGFLRGATGPLAPVFQALGSEQYGGYEALAKPVQQGSRDPEEQAAIDAWNADYGKRMAARQKAISAGKEPDPLPTEMPGVVPGAEWVDAIAVGWAEGVERLGAKADQAAAMRDEKLGEVVYYLWEQQDAIADAQHEAWRLESLKAKVGSTPAPFQKQLIADKEREVQSEIWPILADVDRIESDLVEAVAASEPSLDKGAVAGALRERNFVAIADRLVTITVLGCGICVFLGLLTRVASIAAAGFLVSLMLTQPLGYGIEFKEFIFWAIEGAAFLVLAAVGAGRWAGIDCLLGPMRESFGEFLKNQRTQRELAVQPAGS